MEDLSAGVTTSDCSAFPTVEAAEGGIAAPPTPSGLQGKATRDLLAEFRSAGGQACFEEIVRRYGAMVLHVCRQVTRDRHDAEDATQVVFLVLAERLRAGETIHSLGAWLQQVARRAAIDIKRSRARRSRRERVRASRQAECVPPPEGPGAEPDGELARIIREELDRVPAKYRVPLVLHYFGGMGHPEMARELGIKPPTLNVRLFRGRKMLGERLARRGVTLSAVALTALLVHVVRRSLSDSLLRAVAAKAGSASAGGKGAAASLAAASALGRGLTALASSKLKLLAAGAVVLAAAAGTAAAAHRFIDLPPFLDLRRLKSPIPMLRSNLPAPRADAGGAPATELQEPHRQGYVMTVPPNVSDIPRLAPIGDGPIAIRNPPVAPVGSATTAALPPAPVRLPAVGAPPVPPRAQNAVALASPPPPPASRSRQPVGIGPFSGSAAPQMVGNNGGGRGGSNSGNPGTSLSDPVFPGPYALAGGPHTPLAAAFPQGGAGGATAGGPSTAGGGFAASGPDSLPTMFGGGADTNTFTPAAPSAPSAPSANTTSLTYSPARPLPSASKGIGSASYVWSPDQAGVDLSAPGSVRLTVYGAQPPAGAPRLSLFDPSDASLPTLPAGHTFIDVWGIQTDSPYDRLDLTARYDDALVRQLGKDESRLALWVYDGQWQMLGGPDTGHDVGLHVVWGGTKRPIEYVGVSAPEPGTIGLLATAAAGLLLGRRRRRRAASHGT